MKTTLNDLAILDGTPAFPERLHVGRPNIGNRETFLRYINNILDSRLLTNNGPLVQELEKRIADMVGAKHCIAMCNGTTALETVGRALELKDEVLVPSFTFIATAHSLQWQGITPVFCDIDPATHNIDTKKIEALITPRTTGILGVHVWGRPCDIEALVEIAKKHRLKLFFDAAHAFSCSYKGRMIGNFGDAEVFSFHATKIFNTFEGGAVVTNNDDLAKKIRLMKNFGFMGYDNVGYIGINGKMSEVHAAMGLSGLEILNDFIAVNKRNYERYRQELKGIPGISMISYNEREKCNYHYIVLEIDDAVTHISRDRLLETLWAENVLARCYFYPGCHKQVPYAFGYSRAGIKLSETERLGQRILIFPTGTAISTDDISGICQIVKFAVEHGPELSKRLIALGRNGI
ncbi:MAG: aminotransferase class I/II-fold pyridoxal phosphate-dependent enzyme [Candidatus Omnitrophica bacterium]|nr:aminotransferase class I/II-fold pyridoxal phosphate-dependent enzyme [Candidatus Omnitrophota bacterium]